MSSSSSANSSTGEGEAIVAIDVQNDFMPGGALSTTNARNAEYGANAFAESIAKFANSKPKAVLVVTRDAHPGGHKSFASTHNKTAQSPPEVAKGMYKDRIFPSSTDARYRYWGENGREDQNLWPDHCIPGTLGYDLVPAFKSTLKREINLEIDKGDDRETDSYSCIATAIGDFTPHVKGGEKIFKDILVERAPSLDTIYVTGIARNICVKASFLDILNFVTIPQGKESGKITKVVFMYNLTRPVLPSFNISVEELRRETEALLMAMGIPETDYNKYYEIRGDGTKYNSYNSTSSGSAAASAAATSGGRRRKSKRHTKKHRSQKRRKTSSKRR